ncbi:MAG: acyltransferase [Ahniella sp.]|nr:acyltransferase [Ahniella sp.]
MTSSSSATSEKVTASTIERENGFDLLRLLLAVCVVFSHAFLLGGFGTDWLDQFSRGQTSAGDLGVLGFFGLSGFLITQSFIRQPNARFFLASRFLRIFPGFLLALVLAAFLFAPLISWASPANNNWDFVKATQYVIQNSLVQVSTWTVGDELAGLPYMGSLNGPLWSLWPELLCYGFVLIFGITGLLDRKAGNAVLVFLCLLVFHIARELNQSLPNLIPAPITLSGFSPLFLAFSAGALFAIYRDHFVWSGRQALLWSVLAIATLRWGGWDIAGPIILTITLIQASQSIRIRLPADISYGLYLLHFPILHFLSAAGIHQKGFAVYLAAALAISASFACLSWYFLEKPLLRLKSHPFVRGN